MILNQKTILRLIDQTSFPFPVQRADGSVVAKIADAEQLQMLLKLGRLIVRGTSAKISSIMWDSGRGTADVVADAMRLGSPIAECNRTGYWERLDGAGIVYSHNFRVCSTYGRGR